MRSIAGPARTWTLTSFDRLTRIMPPLRSGPLGPWLSRQRPSYSRSRYPTSISTPLPPTTSCAHGACRSESAITRAGCVLGGVLINDQCPLSPADNEQQRTCYSAIWRTTEEDAYVERVQDIQANRFTRE